MSEKAYTRCMEVLALLAFGAGLIGGFWIGRGRLREPESTPWIQARVLGGKQCRAEVRYGFAAEKGLDAQEDSTRYLAGTPFSKEGVPDCAQAQALMLEYYGLLMDYGFRADESGKWIKPKKCK